MCVRNRLISGSAGGSPAGDRGSRSRTLKIVLASRQNQQASDLFSSERKIYSPALRFTFARENSRLSFAMKLALISAGQTASHS